MTPRQKAKWIAIAERSNANASETESFVVYSELEKDILKLKRTLKSRCTHYFGIGDEARAKAFKRAYLDVNRIIRKHGICEK